MATCDTCIWSMTDQGNESHPFAIILKLMAYSGLKSYGTQQGDIRSCKTQSPV